MNVVMDGNASPDSTDPKGGCIIWFCTDPKFNAPKNYTDLMIISYRLITSLVMSVGIR